MSGSAKNGKSTVIPALRYRNAPAAIDWLCKAFGFEKKAVYANSDGTIGHAELTFGSGMVMLSSVVNGTPYSKLLKQPEEIGKAETGPVPDRHGLRCGVQDGPGGWRRD